MSIVYLNGDYVEKEKAVIPVMDRGFLFGDGVYEVIPVYSGKVFRFEQHIDRLFRSLEGIQLKLTTQIDFLKIAHTLLQKNQIGKTNHSIYLQITRGPDTIRHHGFPEHVTPTIFAMLSKLTQLPLNELQKGKSAITSADTRWENCFIKSTSLLANVLLYQQAHERHASETILIRNGEVLEGATSNVFIVSKNTIITPPLSPYILGGITRDLVLELAQQHQLPHHEATILEPDLPKADEIWITSSTREIFPITQLNQQPINDGKPGPIWEKMIEYYREFIKNIGNHF